MNMYRVISFVVVVCVASWGWAESVVAVDYSTPEGIAALQAATPGVQPKEVLGRTLAWLPASEDPYQESAWQVPVPGLEKHASTTVVIEVHFLDAGAGVISASLSWPGTSGAVAVSAARRISFTRCNTESERFAAFEFALPEGAPARDAPVLADGHRAKSGAGVGAWTISSLAFK